MASRSKVSFLPPFNLAILQQVFENSLESLVQFVVLCGLKQRAPWSIGKPWSKDLFSALVCEVGSWKVA